MKPKYGQPSPDCHQEKAYRLCEAESPASNTVEVDTSSFGLVGSEALEGAGRGKGHYFRSFKRNTRIYRNRTRLLEGNATTKLRGHSGSGALFILRYGAITMWCSTWDIRDIPEGCYSNSAFANRHAPANGIESFGHFPRPGWSLREAAQACVLFSFERMRSQVQSSARGESKVLLKLPIVQPLS